MECQGGDYAWGRGVGVDFTVQYVHVALARVIIARTYLFHDAI